MKNNEIRKKYICRLESEKTDSLIAMWIFGFGVILWVVLSGLSIWKEGFNFDWIYGLIMFLGIWFFYGFEKYKRTKKELSKLAKISEVKK